MIACLINDKSIIYISIIYLNEIIKLPGQVMLYHLLFVFILSANTLALEDNKYDTDIEKVCIIKNL